MKKYIVQISRRPIGAWSFIRDTDYARGGIHESFSASIGADVRNTDPTVWLKRYIDLGGRTGLAFNDDDYTLTVENAERYFAKKYEGFMKLLQGIVSGSSLSDFASFKLVHDMHDVKEAYEDELDFYVDDSRTNNYFGLTTLDNFVRACNNGDKFYLGAVVEYEI